MKVQSFFYLMIEIMQLEHVKDVDGVTNEYSNTTNEVRQQAYTNEAI